MLGADAHAVQGGFSMKKNYAGGALLAAVLLWAVPAIAQSPNFDISGFRVEGNSLLPQETIDATLAPFAGPGHTMTDVAAAAEALHQAYAKAGYSIVQVFPPEQTLAGGQVTLRVVEGKIARVSIAGNRVYDTENIRASLPALKEGESPNTARLVAAITLANENPAKQVAVNFQAGATRGEVDARIDVTEDAPEKYIVNYDNAGSKATGYDRVSIAYQNANIANRDQMLTLQLATTIAHPDDVFNIVAGYRLPFYERGLSLDLIGAYSNTQSTATTAAGGLVFTGRGTYLGARLNQGLPSLGEIRHKLSYGADYKDFGNACTVAGSALDNCGSVTTQPLSVTYTLQYASPALQAGASLGYFANLAGGMHGSGAQYTAARAQSSRNWDAWRFGGFVGAPLPGDWQWRVAFNGQQTTYALVPAEQFGIGGAASVRGYDERTTAGDSGFSVNLEAYTPDLAKRLSMDGWQIRGLVFYDLGEVRRNHLQGGDVRHNKLDSIGFGIRASLRKELSIKLDIASVQKAWPNAAGSDTAPDDDSLAQILRLARAAGPARNEHETSAHVSISYSF